MESAGSHPCSCRRNREDGDFPSVIGTPSHQSSSAVEETEYVHFHLKWPGSRAIQEVIGASSATKKGCMLVGEEASPQGRRTGADGEDG